MKPEWTTRRTDKNTIAIDWPVNTTTDFEARILPVFDAHWDNPDCDTRLLQRHLDDARECGAAVVFPGDFFCAMQGKYDKRSCKSKVKPEHLRGDYLDALVRTAADFLEPYAHNIAWIGPGNHETAIQKNHETDLTERLVATLNDRTGAGVLRAGYSGWTIMAFKRATERQRCVIWHTHGYGGGGQVTQDMIQLANRTGVYIEADVRMSGHTHQKWVSSMVRQRINLKYELDEQLIHAVKCSTYKDAYGDGSGGFEVERGHGPRPKAGYWIVWRWKGRQGLVRTVEEAA